MHYIPLTRASVIKRFVTFLEETGFSTKCLLTQTNLPISALNAPESLLPFRQVTEFYEAAARIEGREHLGLSVGEKTQIADLGAYGRLLCQSPTLQDAIHTGILMVTTFTSGERFWLMEQGDYLWICRNFVDRFSQGLHHADHFSVMVIINLIRLAAGPEWRPTEVHFETQAISGLNAVEPLSETKILFDQSATAIAVPQSLLSLPLSNLSDRQNQQQCKDYELLYSSAPATTFPGSIRQIIATLLREQKADILVVANILGVSVRSFQRQLSDLDLTYSRLVDQVRFEQCLRLLRDPGIKLTDIATELGYTDAANFTRAFRRWTGVSPSEFRYLRW